MEMLVLAYVALLLVAIDARECVRKRCRAGVELGGRKGLRLRSLIQTSDPLREVNYHVL